MDQPPATQSKPTWQSTPRKIETLEVDQVFVFGSNLAGIHGTGMAKLAEEHGWAQWHKSLGMHFGDTGKSYAIATKDFDILKFKNTDPIKFQVSLFLWTTKTLKELAFLVTTLVSGRPYDFKPDQIASLFFGNLSKEEFSDQYPNVWLPAEFWSWNKKPCNLI